MRHILLALLLAFAMLAGTMSGARADTGTTGLASSFRAFPPDNCSPTAPFMAFSGVNGSNTFCDSGQDILNNALLPGCTSGQEVVYNGSRFICKDITSSLPTCPSGYFLTSSDGKTFTCQPVNAPVCPPGQVLTFLSGTGFTCVDTNAKVPVCDGTNQFLTYANGQFSCASVSQLTIPDCPQGQVLTKTDGTVQCVPAPAATPSGCIEYAYNMRMGGTNYFYSLADAQAAQASGGYVNPLFTSNYGHGSISEHDWCPNWHYKEVCVDGVWVPLAAGCASNPGGGGGDSGIGGDSGD